MFHGHEDSVEDDADGDAKVNEWVHNNGIETLFEPSPTATTVPLQEDVGKNIPTWWTGPLIILKVWETQQISQIPFISLVMPLNMWSRSGTTT